MAPPAPQPAMMSDRTPPKRPNDNLSDWEIIAAAAVLTAVVAILGIALYDAYFGHPAGGSIIEHASDTFWNWLFSRRP
jgi:hypothetical protein